MAWVVARDRVVVVGPVCRRQRDRLGPAGVADCAATTQAPQLEEEMVTQAPVEKNPNTTPGGEWLYRRRNQHRCPLPQVDLDADVGDLWQCSGCNAIHMVSENPRDGDMYWAPATVGQVRAKLGSSVGETK